MSEKSTVDLILVKLGNYQSESKILTQSYINKWAKNDRLWKGIFSDDTNTKSKVRNTNKIFFRKIWATGWRLLASFYNAYLQDYDNFKIEGRDTLVDPRQAKVLQFMAQYHRDRMLNHDNLFLQLIWSFMNIIKYGFCVGKFYWNTEKDVPEYVLYPNDQVFLDLAADMPSKRRFAIFLSYMTMDEMEEAGYENLDQVTLSTVDENELRSIRNYSNPDPLNRGSNSSVNYSSWAAGGALGGEYSKSTGDPGGENNLQRYRVYECFWREKGKIYMGVTCDFKVWLRKKTESPYGDRIPDVIGTCLTEAHKIIGEGFPEPLAGPQESYNAIINTRKDNVSLALTGHTFVSRFGNVDLQSLVNRRAGGFTLMDDVNAVRHEQVPDVTRSSYAEAQADDMMMQEMSGITAGKLGLETSDKATVAQINYTEANAKVDLFTAIVGETFMREFWTQLAYLIAKFETDGKIFRIANEKLQKEFPSSGFVYDIDIDFDCTVNVGAGTSGRDMEIKQILLAMDRSIMANQATGQLLQFGVVNPQNVLFINSSKLMEDLLPKLGRKNLSDYFIQGQMPQPQPQPQPPLLSSGINEVSGMNAPQIGDMTLPADANLIQSGSMGGI